MNLETSIQYVKGVGPKLGALFEKRGIKRVDDLLHFYPRSYQDQRAARNIASLKVGDVVSLKAQVVRVSSFALGRSHKKIHEILISDSSGRMACKYFRTPYRGYFERFQPHQWVRVTGKVTAYRGGAQFQHPTVEHIQEEEDTQDILIPLYTETEGLPAAKLRKLIQQVIHDLIDHPQQTDTEKKMGLPLGIQDELPSWLREKFQLIELKKALKQIHQPDIEQAEAYLNYQSAAHKRLIFDEFFWLELYLAAKKGDYKKSEAHPLRSPAQDSVTQLMASLPFDLTQAQKRVYQEILEDLKKAHPMHRLVQGDVGSGKTIVAFMSATYTADCGFQSCIMVPTEILAEQHFKNAKKLLEPLGYQVELLTSQIKGLARKEILEKLSSGQTHLIVGTHALIQKEVEFYKLGLAIVDEQHRFGVHQRSLLKHKGVEPHFLVMTATPIPRTLAMTVYGDLDVSVMDELPKGRTPIVTRKVFDSKREKVLGFIEEQLQKGRQAYVVYPLVEESEKMDLKNATDEFEKLKNRFSKFSVGLLHGKMKAQEKEEIMSQFYQNKIQILVSTTVIEVGVDVPNANIMVIEHAERFGLSQLHQLRGRVGRGEHKSYCVLMLAYKTSEESRERAEVMVSTTDGFKIAEADLELRGPGEFLGTKQSGLPGFRLANLVRDQKLLQLARTAAFELIEKDPDLQHHPQLKTTLEVKAQDFVG